MSADNYWVRSGASRLGRRRLLGGAAAAGAGLAALGLVGCGDDDDGKKTATSAPKTGGTTAAASSAPSTAATSAPSAAAAQPKPGGTLTINGVGNLDAPHLDIDQSGTQLLSSYGAGMAYSRLVRFKIPPETKSPWNSEYSVDLAASVEQPDPTTVVFKMRPNAKFHNIAPVNGRVATAQDVVYSFTRQIQLKVNASLLPPWDAMDATDATTVRFKLKSPNAEFIPTLAIYQNKIKAKEAVDVKGDLKEGPTIGTGPWILSEWKSQQSTTLKKNPDYFLPGLPYLDTLVWLRIGDPSTALAALKAGQIQFMQTGVNPDMVDGLKNDKSITAGVHQQYGNEFLTFKMSGPPFNDPRVRQAVYRALNYDTLMSVGLQGAAYITGGISMPAPDWELPEADLKALYKQDVAAAKSLLAAAGQPTLAIQMGFLDLAPHNSLIQQMVPQLKAAGIEPTLVPLDNVGYIANALAPGGKYGIIFGSLSPSPLPTADLQPKFYTGGSRNASELSDKDFDAMIDKQVQTLDTTARKAQLLDLQKYFHGKYYQWSMGQQVQKLHTSALKGITPSAQNEYETWTRAWLDKA